MIKNTRMGGGTNFQFRFEMFNMWNWHIFAARGQPNDGLIALVNDLANPELREVERHGERPAVRMQVAVRFEFQESVRRVIWRRRVPRTGGSATPLFQRMLQAVSCLTLLLTAACSWSARGVRCAGSAAVARGSLLHRRRRAQAGDLDAAEAAFSDVLKAWRRSRLVHHNLGIVLLQRGAQR